MRVFISWFGDLSKRLAAAIHKLLPDTLQYVKPYFTPDDTVFDVNKPAQNPPPDLQLEQKGDVDLTKPKDNQPKK